MKNIILSMPEFYLYVVFVVLALIAALWQRPTRLSVGEPRATAPTTGRASPTRWWRHVATATGPPGGVPPWRPSATVRPFPDLEAALSASYAARLEQAVRTIRLGPPRWGAAN